jgi:hypothetical protein
MEANDTYLSLIMLYAKKTINIHSNIFADNNKSLYEIKVIKNRKKIKNNLT